MVCHAIEAMLFASVGCAVLSVLITQMNISSIGFTMAHGAFAGSAIGMFFGYDIILSSIVGSLLIAIVLGPLSDKARMSSDVTLGVLFGTTVATAVFFFSLMTYREMGYSGNALLFGSVLSLYREEIYCLAAIMAVTVILIVLFYKEISAMIFNRKMAVISGIRVRPVFYGVMFLVAIMTALSLPIVGGLLLYVWLVTPAAIAYQFCNSLKKMMVVAPLLSAAVSIAGTLVAFEYSLPVSSFCAFVFSILFAFSVVISPKRRVYRKEKSGRI